MHSHGPSLIPGITSRWLTVCDSYWMENPLSHVLWGSSTFPQLTTHHHGDRRPSPRNQARRPFHCCGTQPFTTWALPNAEGSALWLHLESSGIKGLVGRVGRTLLLISHMHILKLCTLAYITVIKVMCAAWTLIDWLGQIGVIRFNTWVSSVSDNRSGYRGYYPPDHMTPTVPL